MNNIEKRLKKGFEPYSNKDIKLEDIEKYLKDIFNNKKCKIKGRDCSILNIYEDENTFYGEVGGLITGFGGVVENLPRFYDKIYYNGIEVIDQVKFWELLDETYKTIKK